MFIGVDVGSSSARAGIFSQKGDLIGLAVCQFKIHNPKPDYYEHDSNEIWAAVCEAIKKVLDQTTVSKEMIRGIGFDATCSLVVLDEFQEPLRLQKGNVIMWMDHRSQKEAETLTSTGHKILDQMGGSVSCEMSLAKITWLYKQEYYKKVKHLIELPEFLTWKATGSMRRSLCSLVCKWGYSPTTNYSDFLDVLVKKEDIPELMVKCGLDLEPLEPGCCVGTLTEQAASELGLLSSCVVGYPIIDAYAGAIGTILGQASSIKEGVSGKLGLICGTSSCHIVFTKEPMFVKGVWGPYPNVALSGYSCTEGGQSLTGKAIEIMLLHHPHFQKFTADCKENGLVLFDELNRKVQELSKSHVHMAMVAKDVHILPDFHGNRSPISDSLIRGTIVGMSMSDPIELYYYAVLLALCYGTRHIIDSLQTEIKEIYISGGMVRNSLWLQSLADVTGCAVITPKVDPDASVLLGSAMYARAAVDDLVEAMVDMSGVGQVITPNVNTTAFHGKKYQVFLQLYQDQLTYRHLMN